MAFPSPRPLSQALWVAEQDRLDALPEAILRFATRGGRALVLASNLPYEVWLDGLFVGDGGHRCAPGEALIDRWETARAANEVVVRLHWLHPERSGVTFRLPFADPFLADLEGDVGGWSATLEQGVAFLARASGHLARQNLLLAAAEAPLTVVPVDRARWEGVAGALAPASYAPVEPQAVTRRTLAAAAGDPFDPGSWRDTDTCLGAWLRERRPALACTTYDLGAIALHRIELDAVVAPCVLYHAEVAQPEDLWTGSRGGVALADAAAPGLAWAAPFGLRGGRYLHLFHDPDAEPPFLRAWRREVRLPWRRLRHAPEDAPLVAAARANLVACVDGGLVDTCWRERVQWTGDLRMSALALRALADAPQPIDLALHQVAASYDPEAGQVLGAWPSPLGTLMPTYHLAFCLAALEQDPRLERDPLVRRVVESSVARWRERYLQDGLLRGVPGWTFTDWEPGVLETMGWALPEGAPHAVVNAWWAELCQRRGEPSGIDAAAYAAAFAADDGFRLVPAGSRAARRRQAARGGGASDPVYLALPDDEPGTSPHATAAAVNAGLAGASRERALDWLVAEWRAGRLVGRVTPYFGYFVARALASRSLELGRAFVRGFYGPEAASLGTISEKGSPADSRAHGWSVAMVALLVDAEGADAPSGSGEAPR